MRKVLNVLRWLLAVPLIIALFTIVLSGIPASAISGIAGDEEAVKSYLKESGIYENFIAVALQAASRQFQSEGTTFFKEWEERITDNKSDLGKLVLKVADPKSLQEKAETVVDAFYAWFRGETKRPTFEISILENKEDFIKLLSIGFREKARSLPPCGPAFDVPADFNPLETPCWPSGSDFGAVDRFIAQNANHQEFNQLFAKATFSSERIEIRSETIVQVQKVFSIVRLVPRIFLAALAGLSLLLLLIVPRLSRGFKTAGIVILAPSLLLIIGRILAGNYVDTFMRLLEEKIQIGSSGILSDIFENLLGTIYVDILGKTTVYAAICIIAGIFLIAAARFIKRKQILKRTAN